MFGRSKKQQEEQRSLTVPGGFSMPDGARAVTPEAGLRVADIFACVRCLSDSCASLPLIVYRRTPQGRQRAGGRAQDLLDRPAPATTTANLVGTLVAHLCVHGNAYVGKFRNNGRVEQLATLDPRRVEVEVVGGEPSYRLTSPTGEVSTHGTDEILHVRALSTDGVYGMSPIRQCAVAMRVAQGAGTFLDSYLAHGARPSGVLKVDGTGEFVTSLSDQLEDRHSGARNMHKVAIVGSGGDVSWTAMGASLDDFEFAEHHKLSTAEIARVFRIPPWLIGAPSGDSLTYSSTEQQMLAFVTHSLRPWLVLIEQAFTADSDICRGPSIYTEFLVDALLRGDSKTRAEVYAMALDPITGWMRRDEVRRLENLEQEQSQNVGVVVQ